MAGIEYRHVVLFSHFIDGGEQRSKVLFGVDVLFPVRGKQNIFAFFKTQSFVNVRGFNFIQIAV